ncbi:MAG: nuclease-related domain-containing protein, partial [Thermodesulfovibrio sp.]|nr:nuclease-related domain-containing protein [Thermodesulfovibrio sp.]
RRGIKMNHPYEVQHESFPAKVIKQAEEQKEELTKNVLQYGGVLWIVFSVLGIIFQSAFLLCLGGLIFVGILIFLIGGAYDSQVSTFKAGLIGESTLKSALRNILSSDYTVYYNYPTPYGDIDALVVGPTGVYVLEVKHHNGYIKATENGWKRVKVGRGGTVYAAPIGNPETQAKRNALYVKELLKQNGIATWVKHAVVLTNPSVKLQTEGTVNVFHIREVEKIFFREKIFSDSQIKKINSILQ